MLQVSQHVIEIDHSIANLRTTLLATIAQLEQLGHFLRSTHLVEVDARTVLVNFVHRLATGHSCEVCIV